MNSLRQKLVTLAIFKINRKTSESSAKIIKMELETKDQNNLSLSFDAKIKFYYQEKPNQSEIYNFIKGVKWSPDGTCILSASENNSMQMFEM